MEKKLNSLKIKALVKKCLHSSFAALKKGCMMVFRLKIIVSRCLHFMVFIFLIFMYVCATMFTISFETLMFESSYRIPP